MCFQFRLKVLRFARSKIRRRALMSVLRQIARLPDVLIRAAEPKRAVDPRNIPAPLKQPKRHFVPMHKPEPRMRITIRSCHCRKGENVSTTEVEGVVSRLVGDVDVAVLGVVIPGKDRCFCIFMPRCQVFLAVFPGCEGRAGMACIGADDSTLNMAEISAGIRDKLPAYARPVFLRFLKHIEVTGKVWLDFPRPHGSNFGYQCKEREIIFGLRDLSS